MLFKKQNKRKTKLLVLMPVWSVLHLICKEKEKEKKTKQLHKTVHPHCAWNFLAPWNDEAFWRLPTWPRLRILIHSCTCGFQPCFIALQTSPFCLYVCFEVKPKQVSFLICLFKGHIYCFKAMRATVEKSEVIFMYKHVWIFDLFEKGKQVGRH